MNDAAIRLEEQIISLFPGMETLVCHGWILKKTGRQFWVYPLYYKSFEGNIQDNIHRCEEISRQSGGCCVFRIVEHTNYHLSSILMDIGYTLWKCGIVCELCMTDLESCLSGEEKERNSRLVLRKEADEETGEYVMSEADTVIGIKRQGLLFLPDGNLPDNVDLGDILRFSMIHGITKVLADIPAKEELPEQYKRAGFHRVYLYRCYQRQEERDPKKQVEESLKKQEEKSFGNRRI